ncbi:MAG: recombinase family protein [Syntrophobacteraceae bacterium]|nr:recombinase family protein [Syntrophobacteraceae bacterium]
MKIGYARVSTEEQNTEIQFQALQAAGCGRIFQEKLSGKNRNRPELERLLDQLRQNDVLVVWKLDRLARSTRDLLDIVEEIMGAGAGLQSLSEPWADTTGYAGKMVLTIFAGIAEFERDLIRDRTSTGRVAAKKRGVRFGRPLKLNPEQKELAAQLFEEGKSAKQIAKTFNVHPATIYRIKGCIASRFFNATDEIDGR